MDLPGPVSHFSRNRICRDQLGYGTVRGMLKNLRTFVQTAALILAFAAGGASAQQAETVASRPDIKAEAVRVPDGFKAGVGNRVLVRVRNLSRDVEVETPFTVRLEMIREDGERTVFESTVDRLGRNQARELTFSGVSVPHGRAVRFLVVADPDRSVEESDYGNNRYIFQVGVEGGSALPAAEDSRETPPTSEEPPSDEATLEEPPTDEHTSEEPIDGNEEEPASEEPIDGNEGADFEGAEQLEDSGEPVEDGAQNDGPEAIDSNE